MLKNNRKIKITFLAIIGIITMISSAFLPKLLKHTEGNQIPQNLLSRAYDQITLADEETGVGNVKFSVYFLNNGVKEKGTFFGALYGPIIENIPTKDLYMELKVLNNGYLKNASIEINTTNTKAVFNLASDDVIDGIYTGPADRISLKRVNAGTTKIIKARVEPNVRDKNDFSRNDNTIKIKGTYVYDTGTGEIEHPFEKQYTYKADVLYDKLKVNSIPQNGTNESNTTRYQYNNKRKPYAEFSLMNNAVQYTGYKQGLQPYGKLAEVLEEFTYKATMPKFNGYYPEEVSATLTNNSNNIETTYNKTTGELVIKYKSYNKEQQITRITVQYPQESGNNHKNQEIILNGKLTVTTSNHEGYEHPLRDTTTSLTKAKIEYVEDMKWRQSYISINPPTKDNPSDRYEGATGLDKKEPYTVVWHPYDENNNGETGKIVTITEDKSNYEDNLIYNKLPIGDITTNTGISFRIPNAQLSKDSVIRVYNDETGELIHIFNKNEILEYSNKDYKYSNPIKHIKIEMQYINTNTQDYSKIINIINRKEIDDEKLVTKISKEGFEKLNYITSGIQITSSGKTITSQAQAGYYETQSPTVEIPETQRRKVVEQASYNGINNTEDDDFTYKMIVRLTDKTKSMKIIDAQGAYIGNDKLNFNNDIKSDNIIKYKGISFGNLEYPDDVNVKIYNNDTNELIESLTKEDLKKYESEKLLYPEKIKHIRIETNAQLIINHLMNIDIKELTKDINKENYYNTDNILFSAKYTRILDNGEDSKKYKTTIGNIKNNLQVSKASGYFSNIINTYQTQKNVEQSITLSGVVKDLSGREISNIIDSQWKKGIVLIEYPEEVKEVKVNDIRSYTTKILGYDQYQESGKQYLKIYTDSDQYLTQEDFRIISDITVDPTTKSKTTNAKIYYYNPYINEYNTTTEDKFDINGNGKTNDLIGLENMKMELASPDTLIITQELQDYNTKGDITYAPGTGIIESNGTGHAKVKVKLANHWTPKVSNIRLFGKIPFQGNKTMLTKQDIGSTFTSTMLPGGIELPSDIENAKVYYSENIDINTEQINSEENHWKEANQVQDWSNIKSYYIDLGKKVFQPEEIQEFTYGITIPLNTPVNEKTFSTVAATFNLNTVRDGNLPSSAESNKVGVELLKRYDLNVNSLIKGLNSPLQNTIYKVDNGITGEENFVKTGMTDQTGNLKIKDLKVNQEYILTEQSVDQNYDNKKATIKFKLVEKDNGRLELEVLEGNENIKSKSEIQPTSTSNAVVNISLEYLQKYQIQLNKKEKGTNKNIKNVKYQLGQIVGTGKASKFEVIDTKTTDNDGNITFEGLKQNNEYVLKESEAYGYYLNPDITFKTVDNNGTPSIQIMSGESDGISIEKSQNGQHKAQINVSDEKIRTFSIELTKTELNKFDKKLPNAQFIIKGDGMKNGKIIETNSEGKATITGLYEYKEGKSYSGEYTIEEIAAPSGYTKNNGKLKIRLERDKAEKPNLRILERSLLSSNIKIADVNDYFIEDKNAENPKLKFVIEDKPVFKLIKQDKKTKERLGPVWFTISKVNSDGTEAKVYDANGNQVGGNWQVGTNKDGTPLYHPYGLIGTDPENGEFTALLTPGVYKFVEMSGKIGYYMPQDESQRSYYVGIGETVKPKYAFKEDTNFIKGVNTPEKGYGLKNTYSNGKTIHYKVGMTNKSATTPSGTYKNLYIYDDEFNVIRTIDLESLGLRSSRYTLSIGKDGTYYITDNYNGIIKISPDGKVIGTLSNLKLRSRNNFFGSQLFPDDKKIIGEDPAQQIRAIDTNTGAFINRANIPNYTYWQNGKPSATDGFLELITTNDGAHIIVYDNNLNKVGDIKAPGSELHIGDFEYTEDIDSTIDNFFDDVNGNVYINNAITNKIEIYTRTGEKLREIERLGNRFSVTPDGKVFFFKYPASIDPNQHVYPVDVIVTDNMGNQIATTRLPSVNVKNGNFFITVTGENSIEYSDTNAYWGELTHKVDLIQTVPGKEPSQELVIDNDKVKYNITTTVIGSGGTISGLGETPYEKVEIWSDSTKDINITPDPGNAIRSVKINGEEIPIILNNDNSTMTLPKFKDVREDKKVEVQFISNPVKVITNHYIKGTETKVSPTEIQSFDKEYGNHNYTTSPKDLEKYELDQTAIPTNATGTVPYSNPKMSIQIPDIIVNYYYTKKKAKVITHYKLEKDNSTLFPDNEQKVEIDSQYTTDIPNEISEKYELVGITGDAKGLVENSDDINVTYTFKKKKSKVIVHYKTTKYIGSEYIVVDLPSSSGEMIKDKIIEGEIDSTYQTQPADNVQENYKLIETPKNATGIITGDITVVTYMYKKDHESVTGGNAIKVGPEEIVSKDQLNTYIIKLNPEITNYVGNVLLEFTDKLPYEIDEEKSELDNGKYDKENKTITWDYNVNVNTYRNKEKINNGIMSIETKDGKTIINMTKKIKIKYKNIPDLPNGAKLTNEIKTMATNSDIGSGITTKFDSTVNLKRNIIVTKKWDDNSNKAQKRPKSIKLSLYSDIQKTKDEVETKLVKEEIISGTGDTWNYTFDNLPIFGKTDSGEYYTDEEITNASDFGARINYRIVESSVDKTNDKFYKSTIKNIPVEKPHPENTNCEIINTFEVPDEKVQITVNKHWDDNNNQNQKRPTSIKYILNGGKAPIEQIVTGNQTTDNNWSYTFTNLSKYDENGNEIMYTLDEEPINSSDLQFYTKTITGNSKIGINIVNKFTVPNDKISVKVNKHWEDNNNQNHKRPISIKYVLKGGTSPIEQTITGNQTTDENWNYTFTDLPKYNSNGNEIKYTVEEQEINSKDLQFYTKQISGEMLKGYNVQNTFTVPNEKIAITATKQWEDNNDADHKRPQSIKINVENNGAKVQTAIITGTENTWTHTFEGLPKYDNNGNEITYNINEEEVNKDDLKFYDKQISGTRIKNIYKHSDEKISIQVHKTWEDNSNVNQKRPISIKYILKGGTTPIEQTVTGEATTDNNWNYTFTDLPKYDLHNNEIIYTLEEQEVNQNDLKFYQNKITGNQKTGFDIVNKFIVPNEKVQVRVIKHWEDNNNSRNKRPASIKYILKGGTTPIEQTVTGEATTDNNWNYTFTNLPKYDEHGNEIIYTIEESEAKNDDLKFYNTKVNGNIITGFNIVNKFTVPNEKVNVIVEKQWTDNNNIYNRRPTSIKYILNGGTVPIEQIVTGNATTDENWNYTFTDLPKYDDNGNEIEYTVDEQEINQNDLKFYEKEITGNYKNKIIIKNNFKVPEDTINIQVTKIWDDNFNIANKRPETIELNVKADEINQSTQTIDKVIGAEEVNQWNYTFTGLRKYDIVTGEELNYKLTEEINSENNIFYKNKIEGDYKTGFKVTNTFEVPDEKVQVTVNKHWDDNNNQNQKRPTSIKYILNGGTVPIEQIVTGNATTDENWNYTFINLPKYDELGNIINYTIGEEEVNPRSFEFYKSTINGYNIVNKFEVPDEKVQVKVNKHWNDNNNQNHKRPTSIKYVLKGGPKEIEQTITGDETTDNNWNYIFENLPFYDGHGNQYQYTVEEKEVNKDDLKFYKNIIIGDKLNGYTITNNFTVPNEKIEVQVNKTWNDNNNQNHKRPTSIKYILSDGNKTKEQIVQGNVNNNQGWNYTFANLPKYNENGNEIEYTVDEEEINQNDLKFYTKSISGDYKTSINITNTFTVPTDKINVKAIKNWEDNSNIDNKRPSKIKIQLKNGEEILQTEELTGTGNTWKYEFTNLAKYNASGDEIKYTIDEQEINPDDLKFYTKSIVGNTITNTFTQSTEKISVKVNKHWDDNNNQNQKRPSSIKYVLKNGNSVAGEYTATGNQITNNNWSYTFTDLPKYDSHNNEIIYTVEEQEVNKDDLKMYTKSITGNIQTGFNIVNTFTVPDEKINVQVNKAWEDNSNANHKRPTSIKYILSGDGKKSEQEVTGNQTTNDNWSYTFENLPKYNVSGDEIPYTLEEQEINSDDLKMYTKAISGNIKTGFNITNTFTVPDEKINVQVNKTWEDNFNKNQKRPTSIKYILKDGTTTKEKIITGNKTTNDNWSYTFENLPKYNDEGNEINYTVEEQEVSSNDLKFYKNEISGNYKTSINIKNIFIVPDEKINVQVNKTWEDNSNANHKRPTLIKYVLKNGTTTQEETIQGDINTNNNWSYTFENLAKYNESGNEINYTLEEQEVNQNDLKFYKKTIDGNAKSGFNIVNTFTVPNEKIAITATKKWEDNSNIDNKRPQNIILELKNGSNIVKSETLTGTGNIWTHEFTNLPKYNESGDEINYTIDEKETNPGDLKFYTKSIVGNTITNTFTQSTEKVNVSITKKWEDNSNTNHKRPTSIKYVLKNGNSVAGEYTATGNQITNNNWSYTFTDLPKYDSHNNEIIYTVEEQEVNKDDLKFYSKTIGGNYKTGFNITNKFNVPNEKINVKVTKNWDDNNNSNYKRPQNITIELKNGNEIVNTTLLTGTENTWEHEFTDLAKYNESGNEINYTIDEKETNPKDLKFYKSTKTGDYKNGIILTNKFEVPDERIGVHVEKIWADENNKNHKRPESIKFILSNGITKIKEETIVGDKQTLANWSYTFENLAKYNESGNEINYTVDEQEINQNDLKFYQKNILGNIKTGYTITNYFTVPDEKINVQVNKTWIDNNNQNHKRPTSIKYILSDGITTKEQTVTGNKTTNDNWNYTFTDLPKYNASGNEINYTIEEQEVNQNDLKFYKKSLTGNKENGFTITNKFEVPDEKITLEAIKQWDDNSNKENKRPSNIKLELKNGKIILKTITLTGVTDTWKYEFTDLAKYNESGDEVNYTVDEKETNPEDLKFYTKSIVGNTITNTFTQSTEKVNVLVHKTWLDENNKNHKRPISIKYVLKNGNSIAGEYTATGNQITDENWEYTFVNLPKYDSHNNLITYTLEEKEPNTDDLKFYKQNITGDMISGFNVINKFEVPDEKVNVTVHKTWEDNSNAANKRPESIKYVLTGEGSPIEQTITGNKNSNDNWSYTFANLPKYNDEGNEINYTVEEQEVNKDDLKFYKNTTSGNMKLGYNITNKFEVPKEKIEVQVNKRWDDNNNQNHKRPISIKYQLSAKNLSYEQTIIGNQTTDENWSYKFIDIPKYDENGDEYRYTVEEQEINPDDLKFYTKSISGDYKTSINVINKFNVPDEKVNVKAIKQWDDDNNKEKKRPNSITIELKNAGKNVETFTLTGTGNTWEHEFDNLPKYDNSGNEINYIIDEQEVNKDDLKFYTKSIVGKTIKNTFTQSTEKINIQVNKTWIDSNNINSKRPTSIKYVLKNGENIVNEQIVTGTSTSDEDWSYTFESLPKYDKHNNIINYTLEEKEINQDDLKFYTKSITGDMNTGFNVINTFVVPDEKTEVQVHKTWVDDNNQNQKRPTSIKYVLKGGKRSLEQTITGNQTTDDNWSYTFSNLPKYDERGNEYNYRVEEQEAKENDLKLYKNVITGNKENGFNITNTFTVPDEKIEVQVHKTWIDNNNQNKKRPQSIKYTLSGGEKILEKTVTGNETTNENWSYIFVNLPKYSKTGDEITYTLEEKEVNQNDLKFYTKEITGDMKNGFNVKNTFTVPEEKIEVKVKKNWLDNNNLSEKRPQSIKYILTGEGNSIEQIVTGNKNSDENWSYVFINLPKYNTSGNEINYTVEEKEENPGDLQFYKKEITGNKEEGFKIINTFIVPDKKVQIPVTKLWDDNSNVSNKRPSSINIQLKDGNQVISTQNITGTGNTWTYTFKGLPKYNSRGDIIAYTLDEQEVNSGDLQFYTKSIVENTIKNTFTQSTDKINVNVTKTWLDGNNVNTKRPTSIKYILKKGEEVVSTQTVTGENKTDNNWNYTFTGLAKYDENNNEIQYTLEEQEIDKDQLKFYEKQINGNYKAGFNVTNTFKVPAETINVNVNKLWDDNSNENTKRPASIKYILTDGKNQKEEIVTGDNNSNTNWNYTFINLPKYDKSGNEIKYTVEEQEVSQNDLKFYTGNITGNYKEGIVITNKFTIPNETVTPKVIIDWEDNSNSNSKRPSNVIITIKTPEGKVVKESTVTGTPTEDEWNKIFENIPKFNESGDPIQYIVEQKTTNPDDLKFYKTKITGDIDKGFRIINKFEVPPETTTVKVTKKWEDNNDSAQKRPKAIKIQLKNIAAIVQEQKLEGTGNEWNYTFKNISKYNNYGEIINYTVDEIEENTEDLKFYTKEITGTKEQGYVITNKFTVPEDKINIKVNKVWEDNSNSQNKRPESIKYILKNGNKNIQEQVIKGNNKTDEDWSYEFKDLAKYDQNAKEINYILEEQEVNKDDLKFYTNTITGEQTNGFTITNKFTVPDEKIKVEVNKIWKDNSNIANKRPESIKFEVLNNEKQIVASTVKTGNNKNENGWSHIFNNLEKYDANGNEEKYYVQEVSINQHDFDFYKSTITGDYKNGFTITNKFEVPDEKVTPKVTIEWHDNKNKDNKRPTNVKIILKDDEGNIVKETTTTGTPTEDEWNKIFEEVPKYNKNGDPIQYKVEEKPENNNELEFYTITTSGDITKGFKVINTYTIPGTTIDLTATKKWEDNNNARNKRPSSIKIEVKENDKIVADKIVSGDNKTDANWIAEFKELPKYNPETGAEIKYTISESEIKSGDLLYYESQVEGTTIINKFRTIADGKITDSKLEKTSTTKEITSVDQEIPYKITYSGIIKEYLGDAKVKIVDELPFKLDLSKSDIAEGNYDDENKTITWITNIDNIDTEKNGNQNINVEKNITLVYKNLKVTEDNLSIINNVKANIELNNTNKKVEEKGKTIIPSKLTSKVIVKYETDGNTKEKVKEDKIIEGKVGDNYKTNPPEDIDNEKYELIKVDGKENGKITQEPTIIRYIYKKKIGKIIISYVEKSTGIKLMNDDIINGKINEPYSTTPKDIEYYNLVGDKKSDNINPVITEEDQHIIYLYEKKIFNMEVNKVIKNAIIDGEIRTFKNDKFTKLDIPVKKILTGNVKVNYSITVKNTGELKGTTVLYENIPKYFRMQPSENPDWIIDGNKILSNEITLNPGESKELSITLTWINSKENFGTLVNKAGIEKSKNDAGFDETDSEGELQGKNQKATLVLAPKTGLDINKTLKLIGIVTLLTTLVGTMGYTISKKVKDEYLDN